MGKKPSLSAIQHGQILILHKEGLSERKISEKLESTDRQTDTQITAPMGKG